MADFTLYNPLTRENFPVKRLLGSYSQGRSGPLLVVMAGVHGNEPSGVQALNAVLRELEDEEPPFFGTMVGIVGNLKALEVGQRFLDEDLNRIWLPERVEKIQNRSEELNSEEEELRDILELIESHRRSPEQNFFLDCHTTSSQSVPYISVPSDAESIELAGEFPVHCVIGGGDELQGVSDRYLIDHGFRGFTFEAGQHKQLASVEAQAAAIRLAMHRVGCLSSGWENIAQELARTQIDGHHFYEIEYVHKITPESKFRMHPGFCNFQKIHDGDLLAFEGEKPITSRWNARLFLPLYQAQGDDGFSIIHEVGKDE